LVGTSEYKHRVSLAQSHHFADTSLITNAIRDFIKMESTAGLAFEQGSGDYFCGDRLGIVLGSIVSALVAYLLLHLALPKSNPASADMANPG